MPDTLQTPCHIGPAAYRTSGKRSVTTVTLIVLHDTEGGSASSVANYFAGETAGGSAHLVVDGEECIRCLPANQIPWAAPGANAQGYHIEQCGYARWSSVVWVGHWRLLRRAAYKTAHNCHKFGIPPRFLTAEKLELGRSGVTTHREVSKWQTAIGAPGDHSHTDPGPFWPRYLFMGLVRRYYKQIAAKQPGGGSKG